ncbi:MAG TPA: protein adenylyltransferase SelO family protein, partial [Polyangiaceae bacterium]
HGGRYAFANQPRIAHWNLVRLAETLLPLLSENEDEAARLATAPLQAFPALFGAAYARVLRAKLGLFTEEDADGALAEDLLGRLAANEVDYTLFFRRLCASAGDEAADARVAALFAEPGAFHEWAERWRQRTAKESVLASDRAASMRRANPAFIPRNHRLEELIAAAAERGDFQPFETLTRVLERPYEDQPEHAALGEPPTREERVRATFCGT